MRRRDAGLPGVGGLRRSARRRTRARAAGATPVCYTPAATCVPCTSNAQCGGDDADLQHDDAHLPRLRGRRRVRGRDAGLPGVGRLRPVLGDATRAPCSGATPVCFTTAGTCVPCVSNAQCGGHDAGLQHDDAHLPRVRAATASAAARRRPASRRARAGSARRPTPPSARARRPRATRRRRPACRARRTRSAAGRRPSATRRRTPAAPAPATANAAARRPRASRRARAGSARRRTPAPAAARRPSATRPPATCVPCLRTRSAAARRPSATWRRTPAGLAPATASAAARRRRARRRARAGSARRRTPRCARARRRSASRRRGPACRAPRTPSAAARRRSATRPRTPAAPARGDGECGGATPACQPWGACGVSARPPTPAQCTGAHAGLPRRRREPACLARRTPSAAGTTPVCNTTTHACRACAGDGECGGATPACEPSGACGQCSAQQRHRVHGRDAGLLHAVGNLRALPVERPAAAARRRSARRRRTPAAPARGDSECGGATPACQAVRRVRPVLGDATRSAVHAARRPSATRRRELRSPASPNADCSGTTPVCDAATHTCRACAGDGDCGGATPACQASRRLRRLLGDEHQPLHGRDARLRRRRARPACRAFERAVRRARRRSATSRRTPAAPAPATASAAARPPPASRRAPAVSARRQHEPVHGRDAGLLHADRDLRACLVSADCGGRDAGLRPRVAQLPRVQRRQRVRRRDARLPAGRRLRPVLGGATLCAARARRRSARRRRARASPAWRTPSARRRRRSATRRRTAAAAARATATAAARRPPASRRARAASARRRNTTPARARCPPATSPAALRQLHLERRVRRHDAGLQHQRRTSAAPARATASAAAPTPACQASGACGQCSATNAALCTGATPLCHARAAPASPAWRTPTARRRAPVCDADVHTCRGCAGDSECGGATPACQPSGACGQCSADQRHAAARARRRSAAPPGTLRRLPADAQCSGTTPVCDATRTPAAPAPATPTAAARRRPARRRARAAVLGREQRPLHGRDAGLRRRPRRLRGCTSSAQCSGTRPVCDGTTTPAAPARATPSAAARRRPARRRARAASARPRTARAAPARAVLLRVDRRSASRAWPAPSARPPSRCAIATLHGCRACSADDECGGVLPACQPAGACGQCSATNATRCAGATPVCETTARHLRRLPRRTASAAGRSRCATAPRTRAAPARPTPSAGRDADCLPTGACARLHRDRREHCPASAPRCDVSSGVGVCVACLDDSHCSGVTPVCATATHTCVACTSDGPQLPRPERPACQRTGPLRGACTECTRPTPPGGGTKPCASDLGICGCAAVDDRQCGAADSGLICSGPGGLCVPGCGTRRVRLPDGQTCIDVTNGVGRCSGAMCRADTDCHSPLAHCDLRRPDLRCVQCLFDTDCDAPQICDPTKKTCVECTTCRTRPSAARARGRPVPD